MTCSACGAMAPDGSRFCPACGQRLAASSSATEVAGVTRLGDPGPASTDVTELQTVMSPSETRLSPAASSGRVVRPRVDLAPGAVLADRYRVEALLGRGGMGEVYKAQDLRLGQAVALKFLPRDLAGDPHRLELFHAEVRIARQITHPHVTRVYDIVEADGHLFLSMEFIDGQDLAAVLKQRGKFAERDGVELLRQICDGLAAIHEKGVLHRDLKPANIMIDRAGRAHLMDFGLASGAHGADASAGTPAYMAPEQLLEQTSSIKSDLYALGLVLYEMFTGARAHAATTVDELITAHRANRTAGAITAPLSGIEPSISAAIRACLERDPAKRPASARDVTMMVRVVLIDGAMHGRRIAQQLVPMAGGLLLTVGALLLGVTDDRRIFLVMAVAGAAAVALTFRLTLDWRIDYKGHAIHFQNHPLRGERLFIDGTQVAAGGVGLRKTLRGTIERGDGAGERITAESVADPREFRVKVFAESFR